MEKFISIINTVAASGGDCVISGSNITMTGLKTFSAVDVISLKVNKSLYPTGMKYVATTGAITAGDTFRFSITQNVNNILETSTFSYVVDTYANLSAAIATWLAASGLQVTISVSGSLTAVTVSVVGTTSNVSFEIGGTLTSSLGVITPISFVFTTPLSVSSVATSLAGAVGEVLVFSKAAHGLYNGQIVTISGFTQNAASFNGGTYRVTYLTSSTFNLSTLSGAFLVAGATLTQSAASGVVNVVPAEQYGTAAYVNAQASANGSTQTATNLTSYYSCIEVVGSYVNLNMGNLAQRQAFIANVWYTDASATQPAAPNANVIDLEKVLTTIIK